MYMGKGKKEEAKKTKKKNSCKGKRGAEIHTDTRGNGKGNNE